MDEKLFNIINNESKKHNIERSCLIASYMFNQHISNSEIFNYGENTAYMCGLDINNKIYDIGYEQFMRNYDDAKNLPPPQYSIQKPNHLENLVTTMKSSIHIYKILIPKHTITTLLTMLKNASKLLKENIRKSTIVLVIILKVIVFDQIYSHFTNINIY